MSKNNLLVISNNYPNQDNSYVANIFVKEQIKYLKNYFDNVYVVSPVAYGMEQLRGTKHKDYRYDNVKVFFPKYFNNPLFWYHDRQMWINLEAKSVRSLIKKENLHFELIHAHFTWPSGAVGIKLKQYYSTPVVITEHTSSTFNRVIEKKDKIFINTWSRADKIIHVRNSNLSALKEVQIPLQNATSIPNGYDSTKFSPLDMQKCREALHLPLDKKLILNIGNLYSEVKGHKYLIDAISWVIEKRKDVLCIIVGAGKLFNTLKDQIHSLGLEDYIILAGGKPYNEIPLWINACDVFVLPSLRESFGVVQVEAMACGKPVIATRNGGSEEIIISDKYGMLVEPADSEELAEKILVALDREWDREAILKYAERFTWEMIAEEITNIYDQI